MDSLLKLKRIMQMPIYESTRREILRKVVKDEENIYMFFLYNNEEITPIESSDSKMYRIYRTLYELSDKKELHLIESVDSKEISDKYLDKIKTRKVTPFNNILNEGVNYPV